MALWIAAGVLGAQLLVRTWTAASQRAHGFVSHYTASRLVIEGANAAQFYDDDWFKQQVARFEPTVVDIYGANPPTMSLLLLPLTGLEYHSARLLWSVLSLVLLLAVVWWAVKQSGVAGLWIPALWCYAFLNQPVRENLMHAQMYVLVLALLVLVWWAYRTERHGILGMGLGTILVAKTSALMYWPLMLLQRYWRALGTGFAVLIVAAFVTLPVLGTQAWWAYFETARRLPAQPWLSVTAYQTVPGFVRHFLSHDEHWNPEPLVDGGVLAPVLALMAGLAMLGISGRVALGRRNDLVFAAFGLLTLMLTPVSLDYHYTMALLPITILLSRTQSRMRSWEGLTLITGALLIAADVPYKASHLAAGAWAFLAYPKLYGALLLWGLALWLAVRGPAMLPTPSDPASA